MALTKNAKEPFFDFSKKLELGKLLPIIAAAESEIAKTTKEGVFPPKILAIVTKFKTTNL